ncbi:hypothetical protein IQ241_06295 [Romeria aff. gracilis LEGE 07310]|uniref:Uncharacterized protein n=1 Tax=Vasconcelosia minhoensis LEGE 07310 TaxID=915328 RepID=A0A8J7A5N5_9CYAN|nr:hypothetical protein [Romeria gracilis]MBE9076907.1 hypothetical protein [Romeria aff. gracilis LEGE 07310]
MLVILMENQLLSPQAVCPGCPMADQSGQPRWQSGQLRCGRPLENRIQNGPAHQYECQMGFRIAEIRPSV